MKQLILHTILFNLCLLLLLSCSNTKYLPKNESLYVGAKVNTTDKGELSAKRARALAKELQSLNRPRPNSKILGLRFKLWAYNIAGTPKGKGLRYWLRNKIGEPPVLASQVNLEKNGKILHNRLENRGFFQSAVTVDTAVKSRKLTAVYTAKIGPQYHINQVMYPADSSIISQHITAHQKTSLLKSGRSYNLDMIKRERERLDARLKNEGFFYFNPDYLIADVDSTIGDHKVNIHLRVKNQTPIEAKEIYTINSVVVYADYELNDDTLFVQPDTISKGGFFIIDPQKRFNPRVFDRTLIFSPGEIYKREDHNLSLNRLTTLGVYKFVKVRFEPTDTVYGNKLNAFYYLTRLPMRSVRAEVSALTKSNNATGSEISISWKNRNLLKGAELFTLTVFTGAERQISAQQTNISTLRAGFDVNMYVPRIIAPFTFQTNSGFVPKTRFNLGYEVFNRNTQYTLNSFKGLAGYVWKESLNREHQLNLININYVDPIHITPEFQQALDTNIILRRTIERQFIIGSNYNFNYNSQTAPNEKTHNFFFNGNLDLSGNTLGLVTRANINKGKQIEIFGTPFSQYVRVETDVRYYLHLGGNKANQLANRLILGSGWAYSNSTNMPFVKQFFIGGTNSVRAFRARSLGPGTFYAGTADNNNKTRFLPDQPGDIKLEFNTELRAKLFSIVNGAIFIDAGNIWTQKEELERPGSKFSNQFLQQLAVGTGVGLRFDLNFLVLRTDIAFPVRKPYLPEGSRWVIKDISFNNSQWRKENLIFNLAIGYPF